MTKEIALKIKRGIEDKIEANVVDMDEWAEFWGFSVDEYESFLDMAIKALEQEPCEDAISRQAVLDILKDKWNIFSDANDSMQENIDTIEALRPVTAESKTGHWIEHPNEWGDNWQYSRYECSCCHDWAKFDNDFCPNCGAKMVEQEREDNK